MTPSPASSRAGIERTNWTHGAGVSLRSAVVGCMAAALLLLAAPAPAQAEPSVQRASELKKLSLEELFNVQVTSVSKTPERLSLTASAIQVITAEDIRRSGATSIPEALRLATNLVIAQGNAHDWAVSARGFNGAPLSGTSLADKLLVLIDGRSIYTPLFGGVFWDAQSVPLEDIDRIEVISGPGGALWGANAVNGVINIVTKPAGETQGPLVAASAGSRLRHSVTARYGGTVVQNLAFRAYGQNTSRLGTELANGGDAKDAWNLAQGGARVDLDPSPANSITIQGDFYRGEEGTPITTLIAGQNVVGRWTHAFFARSDLTVQTYADRTWRNTPSSGFNEELRTYDIDAQHRFPIGERHTILWGAGSRYMQDRVHNTGSLSFLPPDRDMRLYSGFVQDEVALVPDKLKLTVGSKVERNDFSGTDVQPSARVVWSPNGRHTLWGAVSRAVRSPSRFDADLSSAAISGDKGFASEKVTSYELGYRMRPTEALSLALATFYNEYDDIRSLNVNSTPPPFLFFKNDQEAQTRGVELNGSLRLTEWWLFRAGYAFLHERISATSPAVYPASAAFEANDPHNVFQLNSRMDLPGHVQFDLIGRHVDAISASAITARIPDYFALDARLAWRVRTLEMSVVGQNVTDDRNREFGSYVLRNIYGKLEWRP
jgi:iron complex outermembrane receptor protein